MKQGWAMQLFKLYGRHREAAHPGILATLSISNRPHKTKLGGETMRETLEKNKNALNFRERVLCL